MKLHQLRLPSFFNGNIRDDIQHFFFIIHLKRIERLYQPVPVFTTEYMNNPQELAKIRAMIDDLKSDASVKVKRLDIIGYASPEGTLEANKRLSEGRANS